MADKTKTSSEAKKQARERSILFDLPRLLLKSPSGMLGFIIVLVVVLISVFANVIIPCTPEEIDLANMAQPPCWLEGGSAEHILGTDILGRDVFSRILIGSRVSLLVGIFSVVVAGIIGTIMGILSGYFGGWIDSVVMRITDAFYSIPLTLFAMVILTIMDPGVLTLVFVIGDELAVLCAHGAQRGAGPEEQGIHQGGAHHRHLRQNDYAAAYPAEYPAHIYCGIHPERGFQHSD